MSEDNYQPEILAVNKRDYDVVGIPPYNVGTFMLARDIRNWTFLIYVGNEVRAHELVNCDVYKIQEEIDIIISFMKNGVI